MLNLQPTEDGGWAQVQIGVSTARSVRTRPISRALPRPRLSVSSYSERGDGAKTGTGALGGGRRAGRRGGFERTQLQPEDLRCTPVSVIGTECWASPAPCHWAGTDCDTTHLARRLAAVKAQYLALRHGTQQESRNHGLGMGEGRGGERRGITAFGGQGPVENAVRWCVRVCVGGWAMGRLTDGPEFLDFLQKKRTGGHAALVSWTTHVWFATQRWVSAAGERFIRWMRLLLHHPAPAAGGQDNWKNATLSPGGPDRAFSFHWALHVGAGPNRKTDSRRGQLSSRCDARFGALAWPGKTSAAYLSRGGGKGGTDGRQCSRGCWLGP